MTDEEDTESLAAEYVLGTSDAAERALVASRLAAGDAALARAVQAWEERLAPLAEAVREVEAPPAVYDAVATRLFGSAATASGGRGEAAALLTLRRRLRFWQGAAAGFAALAAALLASVALREAPPTPGRERFVAVLRRDAGDPVMLVDVDQRARRLTVRPLDAVPPAGRAYELWIIDAAAGTPRSLGLIPPGADLQGPLGDDPAAVAGATFAVTSEPPGGSPTGRPSGAPVLAGKLFPASS